MSADIKIGTKDLFKSTRCLSINIEGSKIFVVQQDLQFFAYLNNCPHQNIPLDWDNDQFLDIDEELIQCATHGALFTIDEGKCVSGPCAGAFLTPIKVEIRDNTLYLTDTNKIQLGL